MSEKSTFDERTGYGLGDLASSRFWIHFADYLSYFYPHVYGLAPAVRSKMIQAVRGWDRVNDPVVGMMTVPCRSLRRMTFHEISRVIPAGNAPRYLMHINPPTNPE